MRGNDTRAGDLEIREVGPCTFATRHMMFMDSDDGRVVGIPVGVLVRDGKPVPGTDVIGEPRLVH